MNKVSQLLDDIETFSRNGPPAKDEPAKPTMTRERLAFPDLSQPPPEKKSKVSLAAHQALGVPLPGAKGETGESATDSLLGRLKQQARDVQQANAAAGAADEARTQYLSACMEAVFHYLDDLVKQLNIVKPAIPKEFIAPGNIVFAGMQWAEGATDCRMVPSATEDRFYESTYVRLRIAAPRQLRVERDVLGAESLRKLLHDYNLTFQVEEFKNGRNQIERAIFTFPCEVRSGFLLKADYKVGDVILRTRNIDRFGLMEFRLSPDDLRRETLDELAHLMLGEKSRFLKQFRRTA